MYKFRATLSMSSPVLTEGCFRTEPCTLQGAALTNAQVFDLYSRGVVPPANPSFSEGNDIDFDSTIPRDPHEAFQGAIDNFMSAAMQQQTESPTQTVSPESPSEAPQTD